MASLNEARRIVVKIGSALLVDQAAGTLREDWLAGLAEDLADLRKQGREVVLVSSGAIALGRRVLGLTPGSFQPISPWSIHCRSSVSVATSLASGPDILILFTTLEMRRELSTRRTIGVPSRSIMALLPA